MTAYVTRSPLQLLTNTHMMGDLRRSSRRTSARTAEQEDAPLTNGTSSRTAEKSKSHQTNGTSTKQGKAIANGASNGSGGARGKRKQDYDEEDGDFMFTRTRSKRPKGTPVIKRSEPTIEENQQESIKSIPAKKSRKRSLEPSSALPVETEVKETRRRRSPRNSGDSTTVEVQVLEVKKKRPKENGKPHGDHGRTPAHSEKEHQQIVDEVAPVPQIYIQHTDRSRDVTKIALPFADTPIIRRNKEMRKGGGDGQRRSSLGNRGRRASSLIDSGKSNALPHDDVESSEFYKHVESGLPEPRRMRQLLTWCGTRALGEKPAFATEDSHAKLAAREIQQQLLKDFSTKSEMSDWFSREETAPPPQPPKPNPKNVTNLAKIQELEQQIARLLSERQTWDALLRTPTTLSLTPLTVLPNLSTLDQSLLASPTQVSALTTLQTLHPQDDGGTLTSLTTSTHDRLARIAQTFPFAVDSLAANVHALQQYRSQAERVADEVLRTSAQALEERDRKGREKGGVAGGVREVLRGLSRVLSTGER